MPASLIPLTLTPDSSQLHGYGYDSNSQTLALEFNSNWERVTYHYPAFPPEKFAEFAGAESKGSFFYKHIKKQYREDGSFERWFKEEPQVDSEGGEAS